MTDRLEDVVLVVRTDIRYLRSSSSVTWWTTTLECYHLIQYADRDESR